MKRAKILRLFANEIKEPAKQTADATLEIRSKIEDIQNSTSSTTTELFGITTVIEEVNTMTNSIVAAIEQQQQRRAGKC